MTLRSASLSNSLSNPDFQVGPPEMSFDVNEYLKPFTPTTKTASFGAAPDPYEDPAGFAEWFNNIQNTLYPTTPTFAEWNKSQSSPVVTDKNAAGYSKDAKRAAYNQYKSIYPNANPLETIQYSFDSPQTQGLLVDYVNGAKAGGTPGYLTEDIVKANLARDPLYYANLLASIQAGISKASANGVTPSSNITSVGGMLLPNNVDIIPSQDLGKMIYSEGSQTGYLLTPEQIYNKLYGGDQYTNYVGQTIPEGLRGVFGNSDTQLYPNQQIRLVDESGVLHSGTAAEMAAANQGKFSPDALGDKLYSYQVQNPSTGDWNTVYTHTPQGPSWFESFLTSAAPMLGAAFMPMLAPGIMGLGSAGTAALGAGLGSTAAGVATGKSIGDIAKNAALSAGLTYAGGQLLGGGGNSSVPSGATDAAINANVQNALNNLYAGTQAGITSALSPIYGSALAGTGGPLSSVAGGAASGASGTGFAVNPAEDITLTAQIPSTPSVGNIAGGVGSNLFHPYQSYGDGSPQSSSTNQSDSGLTDDNIVVTAKGTPLKLPVDGSLGAAFNFNPFANAPSGPVDPELDANDITVTAKKPPTNLLPETIGGLAVADVLANANAANATGATSNPAETRAGMTASQLAEYAGLPVKAGMTLADIGTYLRLAGYGGSLLNGLLGGGGSGSGSGSGAYYGGSGSGTLKPVFSASLPAANLPGASSNFAPRTDVGTVNGQPRDWTQYGFGPEQSFFDYVPQRGYAHGGDVHEGGGHSDFAVRGPGDGRSDDIPAVLSDGEYVMDAETVAMLGNGSSKAGAEALDRLRVNLRKHKGKKLAKGEFSVDAKKPEQYLAGGRI